MWIRVLISSVHSFFVGDMGQKHQKYTRHFPKYNLLKKYLSIIVLVTFSSQLLVSCSRQEDITGTDAIREGIFYNTDFVQKIKIAEPGRIHNDILDAFYGFHNPHSKEKLPAPEFVKLAVKSMNTVLKKENIAVRVTEYDVAKILKGFIELEQEGMMNVFEPTREGLISSFDCAIKNGYLDKDAAKQYLTAILKTEKLNFSSDISVTEFRKKITCFTKNPYQDQMFLDILYHSYKFWSSIENDKLILLALGDSTSTYDRDLFVKVSAYGTDVLYSLLGIAMFPVTVGSSLIFSLVSPLASIAMECLMGDFVDWINQLLTEN